MKFYQRTNLHLRHHFHAFIKQRWKCIYFCIKIINTKPSRELNFAVRMSLFFIIFNFPLSVVLLSFSYANTVDLVLTLAYLSFLCLDWRLYLINFIQLKNETQGEIKQEYKGKWKIYKKKSLKIRACKKCHVITQYAVKYIVVCILCLERPKVFQSY